MQFLESAINQSVETLANGGQLVLKGAAMSILNLGAGFPVFLGPAIVGLFIGTIGAQGVVWVLAILYFISALLTKFITIPENKATKLVDAV